jgi:anaerobic selenocysteine-containing dehydrogenase
MSQRRFGYRVCPFCEATCGVQVEVDGSSIVNVRGDKEDPFSRGYICPKAYGLKELYEDPDRLRKPLRRTSSGWEEITWDEAYHEVTTRLLHVRKQYGNRAVGIYTGNPMAHDFALPHGWGHDVRGSGMRVAKEHPGVNINALTDNQVYDEASGTAVVVGIPVTVEPIAD